MERRKEVKDEDAKEMNNRWIFNREFSPVDLELEQVGGQSVVVEEETSYITDLIASGNFTKLIWLESYVSWWIFSRGKLVQQGRKGISSLRYERQTKATFKMRSKNPRSEHKTAEIRGKTFLPQVKSLLHRKKALLDDSDVQSALRVWAEIQICINFSVPVKWR
jgi:hypothetical protein